MHGIGTPSFEPGERDAGDRSAYRSGQDLPSFTFIEHSAPEGCDYRDERVWPLANPGLVTKPPILGIDALRMDVAMMPEQHFRCSGWRNGRRRRVAGSVTTGRRCGTSSPTRSSSFRAATWAGLDMSPQRLLGGGRRPVPPGWLHVKAWIWYPPEGGTVDPSEVMERVRQLDRDYDLRACYYDPRYSTWRGCSPMSGSRWWCSRRRSRDDPGRHGLP